MKFSYKPLILSTLLVLPTVLGTRFTGADTAEKPAATKTQWATGLRSPQGIARGKDGNICIAEYSGGQIAKFAPDGKLLGKIGTDLKSPAWVERVGDAIYVSERKANRLLKIDPDGAITVVGPSIEEPLGLAVRYAMGRTHLGAPRESQPAASELLIVAHTTSRIWGLLFPTLAKGRELALAQARLQPIYSAPTEQGKRYGYRCIAVDHDGTIFITDEVEGQLLMLTRAGRLVTWVRDLDDPTAVVVGPDGQVYIAEEGAGRVSRISAEGVPTVVAEGLGQPRDIEFLDARTLLVSDRQDRVIWRIQLP